VDNGKFRKVDKERSAKGMGVRGAGIRRARGTTAAPDKACAVDNGVRNGRDWASATSEEATEGRPQGWARRPRGLARGQGPAEKGG